ncbi:MAG: glycoside hydrolase family 15 protein [Candidatus Nanohaloarchaea archaeon]|nr:glycoside hydrolase family 15 protein [Candidatus Nanohaloarchaea archaeon]
MGSVREKTDFLGRLDARNLRMGLNTARILGRPSLRDWWYGKEIAWESLTKAARHFVKDQDRMNDFQMYSAEDGYVSTPEDGVLAGVTEEGRLSSFFYPSTGFTQQIPYFVWDDEVWSIDWREGPGPLSLPHLTREERGVHGSKPREGGFLGYRQGEEVTWLWEDDVDHGIEYVHETGMLELTYEDDAVAVTEQMYVLPGEETVVRDFEVENRSQEDIDGLVYYMQANANDCMQYSIWTSKRNRAVADEGITWTDLGERTGLLGRIRDVLSSLSGNDDGGKTEIRLETDAEVAESGVAETDLDRLFEEARNEVTGAYIGGYLDMDVSLAPDEGEEVSVFLHGGETGPHPDREERQDTVYEAWDAYHEGLDLEELTEAEREQYLRSLNALMMLYDPHSGSISAAPNTQPTYYPSWPRDAAFSAVALARAGQEELAKDYLGRFLPSVQEEDGSFRQCYGSNGEFAGIIEVENDQQPAFVWAVRKIYDETEDEEFLEQVWPTVEAALEYSHDAITDNDLLSATHDFAEMPKDARQSMWTNAFAYRAFRDGAYLADEQGIDGSRFEEAAERVGAAVEGQFVEAADEGFYTYVDMFGWQDRENTAFAAAVHPSGWAADYAREEELLDAFEAEYDGLEGYWLPKEFILASALYRHDRDEAADRVVNELLDETTPAGSLVEEVRDDGEHLFATLGWSQAAYLLAMEEKYD